MPRQIDRGGPIILVQVENEYGAYGNDKDYLRGPDELTRGSASTVPLTTVDQPHRRHARERQPARSCTRPAPSARGSRERLDTLRRHQPTGPLMCSEFWDGWFDDWGGHHHVTARGRGRAAAWTNCSRRGASVNIYMFHGGTNFGFTNGANDKGTYQPIITSYDYDAPLDEAGNPTAKYWAFREVIARYAPGPADDAPAAPAPRHRPAFTVAARRRSAPLWDVLDRLGQVDAATTGTPTADDDSATTSGFTLYRTDGDRDRAAASCRSRRSATGRRCSSTGRPSACSPATTATGPSRCPATRPRRARPARRGPGPGRLRPAASASRRA